MDGTKHATWENRTQWKPKHMNDMINEKRNDVNHLSTGNILRRLDWLDEDQHKSLRFLSLQCPGCCKRLRDSWLRTCWPKYPASSLVHWQSLIHWISRLKQKPWNHCSGKSRATLIANPLSNKNFTAYIGVDRGITGIKWHIYSLYTPLTIYRFIHIYTYTVYGIRFRFMQPTYIFSTLHFSTKNSSNHPSALIAK